MNYDNLIKEIDKSNLRQVLLDFPKQIEDAYKYIDGYTFDPEKKNIKNIVLCGMGGSSLPADIVNNICFDELNISLIRDYDLPAWVDKDTLVFINSHSGNTEETLETLEQVILKTKNIVVITAGGELKKKAEELNLDSFIVASDFQPRCMTGYFLVYILHTLFKYGLIEDHREDLLNTISYLEGKNFEDSAKEIVEHIGDSLPIVYSSDQFSSLARIWKIKINENSKTQCFFNVFPELNHNEMVGFTNLRINPTFILLKSSLDHPRVQKRMDIFENLLKEKSTFVSVDVNAGNELEHLLGTLMLGDFVSYYLALKTGVDPTPVDMVEDFKKLMKD